MYSRQRASDRGLRPPSPVSNPWKASRERMLRPRRSASGTCAKPLGLPGARRLGFAGVDVGEDDVVEVAVGPDPHARLIREKAHLVDRHEVVQAPLDERPAGVDSAFQMLEVAPGEARAGRPGTDERGRDEEGEAARLVGQQRLVVVLRKEPVVEGQTIVAQRQREVLPLQVVDHQRLQSKSPGRDGNPKFEYRNPITTVPHLSSFWRFGISICFGFRISCFEFPRGAMPLLQHPGGAGSSSTPSSPSSPPAAEIRYSR